MQAEPEIDNQKEFEDQKDFEEIDNQKGFVGSVA